MLREDIARYKALDFFARQVVEGFIAGRHRSPFHGFSSEFSDYRQYNTGESTQHIDWHLYARTDRLYVRQYEEETNLRCQLVIDQSASMLFPVEGHANIAHPNKLTFSVYAAAVLVELLHRQRDAFGLTLISNGLDQHSPCRSNQIHKQYVFQQLESLLAPLSPNQLTPSRTSFADELHLLAEQLHRRSLVVIFSDALVEDSEQETLLDALRHLRHNKHEVILFHTFDRKHELNLDFDNKPYKFIDLESGKQVRLQPSELAQSYSQTMNSMQSNLQKRAMQYRVDYIPVDVAQGFDNIILPFLLKRSKM